MGRFVVSVLAVLALGAGAAWAQTPRIQVYIGVSQRF